MAARPATIGQRRGSGSESRPVKEEIRATPSRKIAAGEALFTDPRLRGDGPAAARERPPLRPRHGLPRRAGPGEDAHVRSLTGLLDEPSRSSPAARSTTTPTPRSTSTRATSSPSRRRHADRLDPPRPPLRREAGDPGHVDRRPHRRNRPDQGRPGPLPLRRADHALRPDSAHQPRHLRHQRAARPRRADPGRPLQRARGARHPDPRLPDPPAARHHARLLRQPRGLHQPRPHRHAAEGPLRQPDPHPLPARRRHRDGHRPAGGPLPSRRGRVRCRST